MLARTKKRLTDETVEIRRRGPWKSRATAGPPWKKHRRFDGGGKDNEKTRMDFAAATVRQ